MRSNTAGPVSSLVLSSATRNTSLSCVPTLGSSSSSANQRLVPVTPAPCLCRCGEGGAWPPPPAPSRGRLVPCSSRSVAGGGGGGGSASSALLSRRSPAAPAPRSSCDGPCVLPIANSAFRRATWWQNEQPARSGPCHDSPPKRARDAPPRRRDARAPPPPPPRAPQASDGTCGRVTERELCQASRAHTLRYTARCRRGLEPRSSRDLEPRSSRNLVSEPAGLAPLADAAQPKLADLGQRSFGMGGRGWRSRHPAPSAALAVGRRRGTPPAAVAAAAPPLATRVGRRARAAERRARVARRRAARGQGAAR